MNHKIIHLPIKSQAYIYAFDIATKNLTDLESLISILPQQIQAAIKQNSIAGLEEIVVDRGRSIQLRYRDNLDIDLKVIPTGDDILTILSRMPQQFTPNHRAGLDGTLHRISARLNNTGEIAGLTLRVGQIHQPDPSRIEILFDILRDPKKDVLIIGLPGSGKTTLLRQIAYMLSLDLKQRVDIVDKSSEIAGLGDIPHPAVGRSRNHPVYPGVDQSVVLRETIQNHTPRNLIVDEIATREETQAANFSAQMGTRLIATMHGNTLSEILADPNRNLLLGGVEEVSVKDDTALENHSKKIVSKRKSIPVFDVAIILDQNRHLTVINNLDKEVDRILTEQSRDDTNYPLEANKMHRKHRKSA